MKAYTSMRRRRLSGALLTRTWRDLRDYPALRPLRVRDSHKTAYVAPKLTYTAML